MKYWYEPKFVVTHRSDGSPRHPDDIASDPHATGMVDKSKPLIAAKDYTCSGGIKPELLRAH